MARLISPNNIWSWMLLLSQSELLQCSSTVYYIQKLRQNIITATADKQAYY